MKKGAANRPRSKDCDWCGPDVPTPGVVCVVLTTPEGELLDSINLCEECARRPIAISKNCKSLDSAD